MRILICCPLATGTSKNGRDLGAAFTALGHEVAYVDIDWRLPRFRLLPRAWRPDGWREQDDAAFNRLLLARAQAFRPALFLSVKPLRLFPETLHTLRRAGIRTAGYWIDDPLDFERSCRNAPHFEHYFTNDRGSVARYAERGVAALHLPSAVDLTHFRPLALPQRYPVSFVGTQGAYRQQILARLGEPVHAFGPGWDKARGTAIVPHRPAFGPATARVYNQSLVNLNIHNWQGQGGALNLRLFEVPACGRLLLTDWVDEIGDYFEPGEHLAVWRDEDGLREQLARYRRDPAAAERIGQAGLAHVRAHHHYGVRCQAILQAIGS
ncbi:glycosyltransferase [Chitiniphilus purpureus]|uniref:Glycosyltransferase n=1 Tax=Chitiniphilus purpureus TaxID=2981137 RepID=A0ABY6DMI8_9NEIS|nr:glycosyltransferase [Chitiniphilus sp. CD1]UXY15569.1 glycosyltransferase [Chitiniphilus sp. CD1]